MKYFLTNAKIQFWIFYSVFQQPWRHRNPSRLSLPLKPRGEAVQYIFNFLVSWGAIIIYLSPGTMSVENRTFLCRTKKSGAKMAPRGNFCE